MVNQEWIETAVGMWRPGWKEKGVCWSASLVNRVNG